MKNLHTTERTPRNSEHTTGLLSEIARRIKRCQKTILLAIALLLGGCGGGGGGGIAGAELTGDEADGSLFVSTIASGSISINKLKITYQDAEEDPQLGIITFRLAGSTHLGLVDSTGAVTFPQSYIADSVDTDILEDFEATGTDGTVYTNDKYGQAVVIPDPGKGEEGIGINYQKKN